MQVDRRYSYRWLFILGFISILIILLIYFVSERLIRHLDEKRIPTGHFQIPVNELSPSQADYRI